MKRKQGAGRDVAAVRVVAIGASAGGLDAFIDLEAESANRYDRVRLLQVVWNLLSNATNFTPAAGRIDVVLEGDGSGNARRTDGPRPATPKAGETS